MLVARVRDDVVIRAAGRVGGYDAFVDRSGIVVCRHIWVRRYLSAHEQHHTRDFGSWR